MKLNKFALITINSALLSPFLGAASLVSQLFKKVDNASCLIIAFIMGLVSMKFIPNASDDKVDHIQRYQLFANYEDYSGLINYFRFYDSPDYLFNSLIFLSTRLNLGYEYFFFFTSFITNYLIFKGVKLLVMKSNATGYFSYNIYTFLLVLFTTSFINLLSGVRFLLAGSIFIWAIYFLVNKKHFKSFILLIITFSTHFSYAYLSLALIAFPLLSKRLRLIKLLFVISLLFFFIPLSILETILTALSLPTGYLKKVDAYINLDYGYSINAFILEYIRNAWYFLALIFLLFKRNIRFNQPYYLILLFIVLINFMAPIDVVFNRYVSYFKIIFCMYIIYELDMKKLKKYQFILFFILYFIGFLVDIFFYRYNLINSYPLNEVLFTPFFFISRY